MGRWNLYCTTAARGDTASLEAVKKTNWQRMNTNEIVQRKWFLSVFIRVHSWPKTNSSHVLTAAALRERVYTASKREEGNLQKHGKPAGQVMAAMALWALPMGAQAPAPAPEIPYEFSNPLRPIARPASGSSRMAAFHFAGWKDGHLACERRTVQGRIHISVGPR